MIADVHQKSISAQIFDDFLTFDASRYTLVKGTGGAVVVSSAAGAALGGWLNLPTGALLNDYQSISQANPCYEFLGAPKLPMRVEAKIKISESALNSSSWYFGLTDVLTTGFLGSNGLPPASYHGAVVFKPKGSPVLQFDSANGAVKSSISNIGTFTPGVSLLLSIVFDPNDGVTGFLKPEINGQADVNLTPLKAQPIVLAGMAPMFLSFGIVASTAAAETAAIDYMGAEFYRLNN